MAFPNLLNQEEVIRLANEVAPDISIKSGVKRHKNNVMDNRYCQPFEQIRLDGVNPVMKQGIEDGRIGRQTQLGPRGGHSHPYGRHNSPRPYYCYGCGAYWHYS